jgi:serine/threonine-protein kinase
MFGNDDFFNNMDKYSLEKLLGQGAYGQVYKAVDLKLKRTVALKILTNSPIDRIEKFRREARNQAKVDHPNVCKVYEVNSYKEIHYISMQYIEGETLDKLNNKLSVTEKVQIIKQVAKGLHAAHLTGLIHRDIKPTNILVKQKQNGKYTPYITDFGISKQLDSPALTKEHAATGSPNYMSPEQAAGDKYKAPDIRTDIYSLGVTLYEMLTGKLPHFGETSIEVMFKIINQEPKPVCKQNPSIPKDLGSIVMKCLEKHPANRYQSAQELLEDLNRFLKGDPVKARQAGFAYKIYKKITKHPIATTVTTLLTVFLLMVLGFWISEKVHTAKKIAISQQLGQIINNSEHIMRIAHMMPIHNLEGDLQKVENETTKIKLLVEKMGTAGKAPGLYALGKCYTILGKEVIAKTCFEKAYNMGYKNNDLFYQLGIAYGKTYLKQHDKLKKALNSKTFATKKANLKKQYIDKAIKMFNKVKNSKTHTKYYGKALVSYINQDYNTALEYCNKSRKNNNWFYEALLLSGQIHITLAEQAEIAGFFKKAEKEYGFALEKINKAIEIAKSDTDCYKTLASLWIKRFTNSRKNTEKILLYKKNALWALQKAKQTNSKDSDLYIKFAAFYWHWAEYQMEAGKDFKKDVEKGIEAAKNALKYNSKSYEAYHHLGNCYLYQGIYKMFSGENPKVSFEKAEFNFEKSKKMAPSFILNYTNLGVVFAYLSQYYYFHGQNPISTLDNAVHNFLIAERIDPNNIFIYSNLGGVYYLAGNFLYNIGKDPEIQYKKAIESYEKALNLSPAENALYVNISGTYVSIAEFKMREGLSPQPFIKKAIINAKKSIELFNNNSYGYINLASSYLIFAKYKMRKKQNAENELSLAKKFCDKAVALTPDSVDALETKGAVYIDCINNYLYNQIQSPNINHLISTAEKTIKKGLNIDPEYNNLHIQLSKLFLLKAKLAKNKFKIINNLQKSLKSIENAIKVAPKHVYSYKIAAENLVQLSRYSQNPKIELAKALEYIEKALQIDPKSKRFKKVKNNILKQLRNLK